MASTSSLELCLSVQRGHSFQNYYFGLVLGLTAMAMDMWSNLLCVCNEINLSICPTGQNYSLKLMCAKFATAISAKRCPLTSLQVYGSLKVEKYCDHLLMRPYILRYKTTINNKQCTEKEFTLLNLKVLTPL